MKVTSESLLRVQDLWQAHYQIWSIILLREFIKLNINMGMIITHVKSVELNSKILNAVSNTQTLKMI